MRNLSAAPPHLDAPFALYPVSILKPLKGVEDGMTANVESFFNLDYPDYELLFSIADANDPAKWVVLELMQKHPRVKAKLIIGSVDAGPNPKVNNMIRSYEAAKNDLILISDSNVRVEPSYLKRLVAHLDNGVGVVTAVVAGQNARTMGGHLESAYLNTFYARGMHLAEFFGKPCVVGKSMLFSRSTAARFGGIRALARFLAEDYMTGVAMKRIGMRVVTMCDPVSQYVGKHTVRDFWNRHLRWGRIRKSQAPVAFLLEPLSGMVVSGILGAIACYGLFGLQPSKSLLLHLAVWSACDYLLARRLEVNMRPAVPVAWLLREVLAFPLWLHTASGKTVLWRGRRLALQSGGLLETT